MTQLLSNIFFLFLPFNISFFLSGNYAFLSGQFNNWASFFVSIQLIIALLILISDYCSNIYKGNTPSINLRFAETLFFSILLLQYCLVTDPLLHILNTMQVFIFYLLSKLLVSKKINQKLAWEYFIISMVFISVVALFQFMFQHSVGISILGESFFTNATIGAAKIDLGATKVIRSYGLSPHPNILAFFSLVAFWIVRKTKYYYLKYLFLVCLLVTFSRAAFLAFLAIFILNLDKKEKKKVISLLFLLSIIMFQPLIQRFNILDTAFYERISGIINSLAIIMKNPLGVGLSNYSINLTKSSSNYLLPWELQPVHNSYLLLIAEIGLILSSMLAKQVFNLIKKIDIRKNSIIICILIIALFDHYIISYPATLFLTIYFFTQFSLSKE